MSLPCLPNLRFNAEMRIQRKKRRPEEPKRSLCRELPHLPRLACPGDSPAKLDLPFNGADREEDEESRVRVCSFRIRFAPRILRSRRADLERQLIENLRLVRIIDTDLNLKQRTVYIGPRYRCADCVSIGQPLNVPQQLRNRRRRSDVFTFGSAAASACLVTRYTKGTCSAIISCTRSKLARRFS